MDTIHEKIVELEKRSQQDEDVLADVVVLSQSLNRMLQRLQPLLEKHGGNTAVNHYDTSTTERFHIGSDHIHMHKLNQRMQDVPFYTDGEIMKIRLNGQEVRYRLPMFTDGSYKQDMCKHGDMCQQKNNCRWAHEGEQYVYRGKIDVNKLSRNDVRRLLNDSITGMLLATMWLRSDSESVMDITRV